MDHSKRELWRKRLQDYQESGLSGSKWCKKNGIPVGSILVLEFGLDQQR